MISSKMRFQAAFAIFFAVLVTALPVPAGAATGSSDAAVFQIQNYVHTVADMDKSIAFYRDAMGLAINPPPIGAAPTDRLSLRENLNLTTNTPGATFRPTSEAPSGAAPPSSAAS